MSHGYTNDETRVVMDWYGDLFHSILQDNASQEGSRKFDSQTEAGHWFESIVKDDEGLPEDGMLGDIVRGFMSDVDWEDIADTYEGEYLKLFPYASEIGICDECGNGIEDSEAWGSGPDGEKYCESCDDQLYTTCMSCDCRVSYDDVDDEIMCKDCQEGDGYDDGVEPADVSQIIASYEKREAERDGKNV